MGDTGTDAQAQASTQVALDPADAERPGAPGAHPAFDALVRTIWRLRQPDGCPWDRKQTHSSIAKNMIEEAYEAVDAIEADEAARAELTVSAGDQAGAAGISGAASADAAANASQEALAHTPQEVSASAVVPAGLPDFNRTRRHLAEELGDVLMQVVLQSQIASDAGEFTIDDVCRDINEKLIRRHPHVFGDHAAAQDDGEVLGIWEQVKLAEHAADAAAADAAGQAREGLLDSVPTALPALMACQKISRKAAAAGFEWSDEQGVRAKVREEIAEFEAAEPGSPEAEMEFGDILFALVNWARWEHIDAESALRAATAKFRRRWAYMERAAWDSGREIADLSNSEQEALWAEAKSKEMHQ